MASAARRKAMKRYYSEVLLELCETRQLADITASEFIDRAGTARQTFYNYFNDIYDLISYTASLPLMQSDLPICDPENTRFLCEAALAHPAFYRQIIDQGGALSCHFVTVTWQDELLGGFFVPDSLPPAERKRRSLELHVYGVACTELVYEWIRRGMEVPVDDLLAMLFGLYPQFMKDGYAATPPANTIETYPR